MGAEEIGDRGLEGSDERRATGERATWTADELHAFLSRIFHQLRTPLSVITGRAGILREQLQPELQREVDAIVQEAHGISYAFESVLTVVEGPQALGEREWVPLEEIVGAVLVRSGWLVQGRPVRINVAGPLLVHIHPIRGELLVANLLRRAVALTPLGAPIEIAGQREAGRAAIQVAAGEPFTDEAAADNAGGGVIRADDVSLAACRTIAASYGGTLVVTVCAGGTLMLQVQIPDGEPMPVLGEGGV